MLISNIRSWLSQPLHPVASPGGRSIAQRFAVPHSFPPDLTFRQALIAVAAALARILLGSFLFAIWGVYAAHVWSGITSQFWRIAAILPLVLLFIVPLTALLMGISAILRAVQPKQH